LVPRRRYDTVFFASWLSHVPPELFASFWDMLGQALSPLGRVQFIDEQPAGLEFYHETVLADSPVPSVERRLADGSRHPVVKILFEPDELAEKLRGLGWEPEVWPVDDVMFAGTARPCA
jgi:demethylmenaquinone methyltransferase/2-methoxy-6-polyprenyl-1,4-benzoquinol methylase